MKDKTSKHPMLIAFKQFQTIRFQMLVKEPYEFSNENVIQIAVEKDLIRKKPNH